MELREVTNKEEWNEFLIRCAEKTFLQSWEWGEFNKNMGSKTWRLGAYSNGSLVAVAFLYKIEARRGTFLFVPHGPVVSGNLDGKDKKEVLEILMTHVSSLIKDENASFVRIAPVFIENSENNSIFEDLGFRQSPIHMHPEVTWELNITPPEEAILKGMRKTTRYLIRQAEKNPDIQIEISSKIDDLEKFWPVYEETARRHKFVVFSRKYLEAEFKSFSSEGEVLIFLGKYRSDVVSAAVFVFWQGMCFYHHSGSLSKFNKIPVSYLLQWRAIQEAKKQGCRVYNFWGIAPEVSTEAEAQKSKHPWAGLSLFKMGFGGYKKNYVKTQDFIFSSRYWINFIIEKIRKKKRNL